MQVPKRRSEQSIKRDTGPLYITPEGLERLERQLERVQADLPRLIKEVERTKEHGDFSENAAYQDAKANLRRAHGRVSSLEDRIKRAVLIERGPNTSGTIQIGSTVVVEMAGKKIILEILGSQETNPTKGRISDRSPLGQALLGHAAGDTVSLSLPNGTVTYRILEVR